MQDLLVLNLDPLTCVVKGIESGELQHKQDTWACGAARCVAGWLVDLYAKPEQIKERYENSWIMHSRDPMHQAWSLNPGQWAQEFIGLTDFEAHILFKGDANFDDILEMYHNLICGYRFPMQINLGDHRNLAAWRTEKNRQVIECELKNPYPKGFYFNYPILFSPRTGFNTFYFVKLNKGFCRVGITDDTFRVRLEKEVKKDLVPMLYGKASMLSSTIDYQRFFQYALG